MLAAAPGDSIDCSPGASSFWSDWSVPGCTSGDSPATQVIKGTILEPWVEDVKKGVADMLKTMITFWINVPDPNIGSVDGGKAEVISFLQDKLTWLCAVIMCFIALYQVGRICFERSGQPFKLIVRMVVAYLMYGALAIPATVIGLAITSAIAQWILTESTIGTSFSDNLFSLFNNDAGLTSSILAFLLLFIAMCIAGFQCVIMIGRGGAIFVILGIIQAEAAASGTDTGNESLATARGWLIGAVLYKLAAAAIYGVGFRFLGTDVNAAGNGLLQILYGITLLLMAVFALPATIRLTAPSAAKAAGGRGVGAAAAAAAPIAVSSALHAT